MVQVSFERHDVVFPCPAADACRIPVRRVPVSIRNGQDERTLSNKRHFSPCSKGFFVFTLCSPCHCFYLLAIIGDDTDALSFRVNGEEVWGDTADTAVPGTSTVGGKAHRPRFWISNIKRWQTLSYRWSQASIPSQTATRGCGDGLTSPYTLLITQAYQCFVTWNITPPLGQVSRPDTTTAVSDSPRREERRVPESQRRGLGNETLSTAVPNVLFGTQVNADTRHRRGCTWQKNTRTSKTKWIRGEGMIYYVV